MMETFQTIWNAMTTPNEMLAKMLLLPLSFIEAIVNMLLFTALLNIQVPKKSKITYVIVVGLIASLSRYFIPDPYGSVLNLLVSFILVKFVLKTTVFKSLLAIFIQIILSTILELFLFRFYLAVFKIPYESV